MKKERYDRVSKEWFEKGKLEICYNLLNSFEKRIKDIEELPINHPLKIEQMNFLAGMREITKEIYILIESIEQLQKEIKVSGDSLTEFWDNPEDDRWDKEEEKQDDN